MLQQLGNTLRRSLNSASTLPQLQHALKRSFGAAAGHDDHDDHHEPTYDHTPTVFDRLLTFNVIDINGKRHTVRGMVGQSLSKALIEAGFPSTYFFPNMGFYTQHIVDAHVFIPKDYWSLIPNFTDDSDEADAIKRTFRDIIQDHARETSFLASFVTLTPEMNNMTVGIGPIRPWHLHTHWCFSGIHDDPTPQFRWKQVEIFG